MNHLRDRRCWNSGVRVPAVYFPIRTARQTSGATRRGVEQWQLVGLIRGRRFESGPRYHQARDIESDVSGLLADPVRWPRGPLQDAGTRTRAIKHVVDRQFGPNMTQRTNTYDGDLQMFREAPRPVDLAHLRFLRWLAEHERLEHPPAGPPSGGFDGAPATRAPIPEAG